MTKGPPGSRRARRTFVESGLFPRGDAESVGRRALNERNALSGFRATLAEIDLSTAGTVTGHDDI